jgi:hypothetical protein
MPGSFFFQIRGNLLDCVLVLYIVADLRNERLGAGYLVVFWIIAHFVSLSPGDQQYLRTLPVLRMHRLYERVPI